MPRTKATSNLFGETRPAAARAAVPRAGPQHPLGLPWLTGDTEADRAILADSAALWAARLARPARCPACGFRGPAAKFNPSAGGAGDCPNWVNRVGAAGQRYQGRCGVAVACDLGGDE